MAFNLSPAVQSALSKLPDEDQKYTFDRMQDDLGLAYMTLGSLMRVNGVRVGFTEKGFPAGFDTDMDFALGEIYRSLRVQRAIASAFGKPDAPVLEVEQRESGL